MTTLHSDTHRRIQNINDLYPIFTGSGDEAGHIGAEAEFLIFNSETGTYASPEAIASLIKMMRAKGPLSRNGSLWRCRNQYTAVCVRCNGYSLQRLPACRTGFTDYG